MRCPHIASIILAETVGASASSTTNAQMMNMRSNTRDKLEMRTGSRCSFVGGGMLGALSHLQRTNCSQFLRSVRQFGFLSLRSMKAIPTWPVALLAVALNLNRSRTPHDRRVCLARTLAERRHGREVSGERLSVLSPPSAFEQNIARMLAVRETGTPSLSPGRCVKDDLLPRACPPRKKLVEYREILLHVQSTQTHSHCPLLPSFPPRARL